MDSGTSRSSNRPVSRRGGGGAPPETMAESPLQYRPVTRSGPRPPSALRNGTASRLTSALGGPTTGSRIGTAIGNVGNVYKRFEA
ncbi:hypothetical protein HA402_008395 [Bradysia odoriphaga]|nr:hypothetical protein HA402_008395 [Bradysia odoriphaga]